MAPRIVNKEERRREIARCALDVFARVGFEKASIAMITCDCGIGKGTVYEYFTSKEDLLLGAIFVWLEQIEQECMEAVQDMRSDSALEMLKTFLKTTADVFIDNPYSIKMFVLFTQLMINEAEWMKESEIVAKSTESFRVQITEMIQNAVAEGSLSESALRDADAHAINLIAGMDGIQMHGLMSEGFIDMKKQIQLFIDNYLEGMMQ